MERFVRTREAWLRHPVGARLLHAEQQRVTEVLQNLFGYYLVQAGGWGAHATLCGGSRITTQFLGLGPTDRQCPDQQHRAG